MKLTSCGAEQVYPALYGRAASEMLGQDKGRQVKKISCTFSCENMDALALARGIFGNGAAVVSDSFYRAITKFSYAGKGSDQLFESIDFAVLCRPEKDCNYREFW